MLLACNFNNFTLDLFGIYFNNFIEHRETMLLASDFNIFTLLYLYTYNLNTKRTVLDYNSNSLQKLTISINIVGL